MNIIKRNLILFKSGKRNTKFHILDQNEQRNGADYYEMLCGSKFVWSESNNKIGFWISLDIIRRNLDDFPLCKKCRKRFNTLAQEKQKL